MEATSRSGLVATAAALVLTAGLGLAGCGSTGSHYDTLLELRQAAVSAGMPCPHWQRNDMTHAACSRQDVLAVYPSPDARAKAVSHLEHTLRTYGLHGTIVYGENWSINSPNAPDLVDQLHGTLDTVS